MNHEEMAGTKEWQSMMSGLLPFLSYEPVRQSPRADLIRAIREYVNSGLKPQQEIAREIGLSRTKMSQFMNGAKRVKGWKEVESKLDSWIKEFKKSKKTAHIRFLDNIYTAKLDVKPVRPVVENLYKQPQLEEDDCNAKISDESLDDLLELNSSQTELPDTSERQDQYNNCISSGSKETDDLLLDSVTVEDNWSQFEIGRVLM